MLLPLPITPKDFNEQILTPALKLLPAHMDSPAARVLLTAIVLQESGLRVRYQELSTGAKGPARGLPQFERGSKASRGGVWGVLMHSASTELLRLVCRERDVGFDPWAIWSQMEYDDLLAVSTARLLLLTDPRALPAVGAESVAWDYYKRCWNPGKPHYERWPKNYAKALEAVGVAA